MKVFITGVAGFLGSHLAEHCLKKGHDVVGNDTLIGGDLDNLKDLNLEFHKTDCSDLDGMSKILKGVDIVCHAAAYAHEGLSTVSPKLICENNVVGSTSVFTAAIKNNVKRIVYCSSMARYGDAKVPYLETSEPQPVDPYGVSKVAAEQILKILAKTYNFEYNIAVPHNIIGSKQKYDDAFRNVASIMINLMIQKRSPIIYGDGEQKRCFSDIKDCLSCLDKMMFENKITSEIINIGPDEESVSINQLFKVLSNKLQFNKDPTYEPERPNEVKKAICSSNKAREILSYDTTVSLEESLDKIITYIKTKGPKKFQYNYDIEIESSITPKTWLKKLF